jgi:ABC-type multidrug transport system permease subunit
MPEYVKAFAPYSPVTFAADSARAALEGASFDILGVAGLVAFVAIFLGLGATFYFRRLEGGVYA